MFFKFAINYSLDKYYKKKFKKILIHIIMTFNF